MPLSLMTSVIPVRRIVGPRAGALFEDGRGTDIPPSVAHSQWAYMTDNDAFLDTAWRAMAGNWPIGCVIRPTYWLWQEAEITDPWA